MNLSHVVRVTGYRTLTGRNTATSTHSGSEAVTRRSRVHGLSFGLIGVTFDYDG
jgi:hypothetical protein